MGERGHIAFVMRVALPSSVSRGNIRLRARELKLHNGKITPSAGDWASRRGSREHDQLRNFNVKLGSSWVFQSSLRNNLPILGELSRSLRSKVPVKFLSAT